MSLRITFPPRGRGRLRVRFHHSPKIKDAGEAFLLIGELTLVDDQAGVGVSRAHRLEDFVERNNDVIEILSEKELGRQKRAGHAARHGDRFAEKPVLLG